MGSTRFLMGGAVTLLGASLLLMGCPSECAEGPVGRWTPTAQIGGEDGLEFDIPIQGFEFEANCSWSIPLDGIEEAVDVPLIGCASFGGRYSVDNTTTPAQLTLLSGGVNLIGISLFDPLDFPISFLYEVDGNNLRLVEFDPSQELPETLDDAEGIVLTFRRR